MRFFSIFKYFISSSFQPKLTMPKCQMNVDAFLDACRRIGVEKVCWFVLFFNIIIIIWCLWEWPNLLGYFIFFPYKGEEVLQGVLIINFPKWDKNYQNRRSSKTGKNPKLFKYRISHNLISYQCYLF